MKNLLIVLMLLAFAGAKAQTAKELIEKSDLKMDKKDFAEALRYAEMAIAKGPDRAEYHVRKALCHLALGDKRRSDEAADEIMEIFDTDPEAYIDCGTFYYFTDNFSRAEEVFDEAIKKFTNASTGVIIRLHSWRGSCRRSVMNYQGAYQDDLYAYSLDTNSLDSRLNLALALHQVDSIPQAVNMYEKIIKEYPGNLTYYNNLAWLYDMTGEYAKAIELLDIGIKAMEKKGNNNYEQTTHGLMYSNRGFAKYKLGKHKEALKDLERSRELYPTNSYVYKNLALVYIATSKNKEACENLYKAVYLGFEQMYGDEVNKLIKAYCR